MLVGYARVSTQDQSTNLQLDALAKAGCTRVFSESAPGAQRDRPELARALDYIRPGDTSVVWKRDRLARSLKQLIETGESLEGKGIGFRSLTEFIDTTTAGGKLVFHIFAALAELERSMIRERTRAGLDAARARGRVGGRPRSLTDKDLEVAKTLLANPDLTVDQIAARLSVAPATLYRYLPGGRAALEQVSASLSSTGTRRSDQSQVWADVSAKAERMQSFSATEAAAALYDTHRAGLDEYLRAFSPVAAQLGALFTLNGRVLGLDLFDTPRTLSSLLPKLVESSALDAIDAGEEGAAEGGREEARGFMKAVAKAEVERFDAIGLGEDLRLRTPQIAGGALLSEGRVVHLCAFRLSAEDGAKPGPTGSRLARASQRRRGRL